jgi:curved DNA binding protein
MVHIHLGVHIDGFPVVLGHTIVIGASIENKVTGKKANAVMAAHVLSEVAHKLLKPGTNNYKFTEIGNNVAEDFHCKLIEGIRCHQMEKNIYNSQKAIVWNPNEDQRKAVEKCDVGLYDVWNVNIIVSTGDGKPRESDFRTTVHKKSDIIYQLKMKSSRQFFSEIATKYESFPFSIRSLDERKARMGVLECVKHDLLEALHVYTEREGEFVAQFQFTVLVLSNSSLRITGLPFDEQLYVPDHKVENSAVKEVLATSSKNKKKKKPTPAKSQASEGDVATATAAASANEQ